MTSEKTGSNLIENTGKRGKSDKQEVLRRRERALENLGLSADQMQGGPCEEGCEEGSSWLWSEPALGAFFFYS